MAPKTVLSFTISLILLCTIEIFACSNSLVGAIEQQAPAITIRPDGTINPSTAPISHSGNTYVLTQDIMYYCIDIHCDGIILNGLGHTLSTQGDIQSNRGIQVDADNVTVKNMSIVSFGGLAIIVNGSYNVIENNFMIHNGGGISIFGAYNTITGNNISLANMASEIFIYGNYNNITQNSMWGICIDKQATHNVIVANTLYYGDLMGTDNIFYLNDFYDPDNSGYVNKDANPQGNVFDYNGSGNYWSNYNGTDANNDGIGDTPYVLTENIKDSYPLMAPYDVSSQTTPPHAEQSSSLILEILVVAIVVSCICVLLLSLIHFRKPKYTRIESEQSLKHEYLSLETFSSLAMYVSFHLS